MAMWFEGKSTDNNAEEKADVETTVTRSYKMDHLLG
jgi:hypothetical protein